MVSERVQGLLERMSLEEKLAQIVGFWVDEGGDVVAPMQGEMASSAKLEDATRHGLGHFTRVYGTRPVDPIERAQWLWEAQRTLVNQPGPGIPALVHEECLTGLAAWKAATFPTPLAWGAAFHPELVEEMGVAIGESMRTLGIHQGLAPVLDVIRDARWGRVEECIAEDPYVVGTIATAYVRGLQSTGVHATLKHFVGYSNSRAGRNLAPVHAGPREVADVLLPPFEMAVLDGKVRSVMHSYSEIDGIPVAADRRLLTDLLRGTWGFDGTVVADYFGVAFLQALHGVAGDLGEAAGKALEAGVDIELPTGNAYLEPLAEKIRAGLVDEALVDLACTRALQQKEELGLLDETFESEPPTSVDLDSPEHRRIALQLAEESVVLLANDGVLPLTSPAKVAVIGPNADRSEALFGCYSFANHVLAHHADVEMGFEAPSVLSALREELSGADITFTQGCEVEGEDTSGFDAAVAAASAADVAIVVAGDQAGLFGRGTSGEGNDADSLELPGVQRQLVEAVQATGTPVVLVLLTGRPYAVDWAFEKGAVVQGFFPGEEGGAAVAGILSGRVNPSGRLPITLPRSAGAQPYSYLHPQLGGSSQVSSLPTEPVLAFGHGLSYTTFTHTGLTVADEVAAGDTFTATVTVSNTGDRDGEDVVQLYARDVVGSVTRPVAQLLGYQRVRLAAGETATVTFTVPTTRLAFSDRDMVKIVEPGAVELWVGPSVATKETEAALTLTGDVHRVSLDDNRWVTTTVERD
ncbi:beta-glucosidase [Cellulomonas bogoriensis 69B4 = DSM 16987]|uniref:Beta-glucosidase n=2 Tax=Cellulomonas bogoriensis TaxID=301388 RepID=A0A0A0C186_9CELL|nr:beta-glucosidase [Cellulomonas bogoriensis 69B4 = DSM 16987]